MDRYKKEVQEWLDKTGLSVLDLAQLSGVNKDTIYRWLNKGRNLTLANWDRLQKIVRKAA